MSKSRIEAFSDGVFAILITILVLEFHPVAGRPGTLLHQVTGQMPLLITYLTSYFYVGTLWLFHHDYFTHVKRTTTALNILNLILLFTATLINYSMSLVAMALRTLNHADMQVAFIVYDIAALLISLSYWLIYHYLSTHPQLTDHGITSPTQRIDPLISGLIYGSSILVSWLNVWIAGVLLLLGIVFHFIAYLRMRLPAMH